MAKIKILVVDDQENVRQLLYKTLKQGGFEVITAKDGMGGITATLKHRPDLVLLDFDMPPGMNGVETLQRIRANVVIKNTCIVMLTAHSSSEIIIASAKAGAAGFVVKTNLDVNEFLGRIRELLKQNGVIAEEEEQPPPSPPPGARPPE